MFAIRIDAHSEWAQGRTLPGAPRAIATDPFHAHMTTMATTRISPDEGHPAHAAVGTSGVYRGIRLVKPAVPPRTPIASLRKAVEAAFVKNADAIGRIK